MVEFTGFKFHITPPENGWLKGSVSLGGDSLDFSMSDVLGDDLTAFICAIWSYIPNLNQQDAKYQWRFEDDRLPCDKIVIDEEGSKVTWTITEVEKAKEKMLHLEIVADRNLYQKRLSDDPSLEEGDLVRVPVGDNGRTSVVEIVEIEYFREDEVPMPLERVKKIIGRADDWDDED